MRNLLALGASVFGDIKSPYVGYGKDYSSGLVPFLNNVLRLVFVVGGLIAFFNIITGGFQFLNSGGDSKQIEAAWNKILHSLIGLVIIVSAFIIAVLVGAIVFGDPTAILNPKVYGPGT